MNIRIEKKSFGENEKRRKNSRTQKKIDFLKSVSQPPLI
jgi:hypothetical protein